MRYVEAKRLKRGEEVDDQNGDTVVIGTVEAHEASAEVMVQDAMTGRWYTHLQLRRKSASAPILE